MGYMIWTKFKELSTSNELRQLDLILNNISHNVMRIYAKQEFNMHKDIPRSKMNRIEYLVRAGRNKFLSVKEGSVDFIVIIDYSK